MIAHIIQAPDSGRQLLITILPAERRTIEVKVYMEHKKFVSEETFSFPKTKEGHQEAKEFFNTLVKGAEKAERLTGELIAHLEQKTP